MSEERLGIYDRLTATKAGGSGGGRARAVYLCMTDTPYVNHG